MLKLLDIETLHSISLDIAQIFFAYMVVGQFFTGKINAAYMLLGMFLSFTFWFFSLLLARLRN